MSKLYFRYGVMESGKTTALLQVAHNYNKKGMEVLLLKPKIDTKGQDKVISRLGVERKVDYLVEISDNLYSFIKEHKKVDAIIVDEAQFLTSSQVDELYYIAKEENIPVLCYGLRCDFQMIGFTGSTRLLQIADDIEELKTICSCGKKATQNLRLLNGRPVFDGEQIEIDNQKDIQYVGVCGNCYLLLKDGVNNDNR